MRYIECDIHVCVIRSPRGAYAIRIISVNGKPSREHELYELIISSPRIAEVRSFDSGSYVLQKVWRSESPSISSERWERALSHIERRHGAEILTSLAFSQKLVVSEYAL